MMNGRLGFIEVCAVQLKPDVARRECVDPDSLHWVRRESPSNGRGNGALIVESRISGRTPVIFTITEDEVCENSRQFLRETLGRGEVGCEGETPTRKIGRLGGGGIKI